VLLPDIFHSERNITPPDAEFINSTLGDFLKWLARHAKALFGVVPGEHYRPAAAAYTSRYQKLLDERKQNILPKLLLEECYEVAGGEK